MTIYGLILLFAQQQLDDLLLNYVYVYILTYHYYNTNPIWSQINQVYIYSPDHFLAGCEGTEF